MRSLRAHYDELKLGCGVRLDINTGLTHRLVEVLDYLHVTVFDGVIHSGVR